MAVVSQIKLSMSGDEILEDLRAESSTFSDELVVACVEAAHAKGIRVCSHARSDKAVRQCLQYGIDILYHCCKSSTFNRTIPLNHVAFISDESMDALEAQKDRVYVAPALNILYSSMLVAEKAQCTTSYIFSFARTYSLYMVLQSVLRNLPRKSTGENWIYVLLP